MSSGRGEVEFISIIVKCTRTSEVQEKLTSNFPHGGRCGSLWMLIMILNKNCHCIAPAMVY
jgi:hypothetical protein